MSCLVVLASKADVSLLLPGRHPSKTGGSSLHYCTSLKLMSNFQRYLKGFITTSISKCYHPLRHHPSQSPLSLRYSTTTSGDHSFAASYLVNNFEFSPQSASKWSKYLRFKTSERPESVLSFFRNHGFSDSQIHGIIRRTPSLLLCDPDKSVLPKFQFLLSKGASTSDIVRIVTLSPVLIRASLENHIAPTYGLLKGFFQSDDATISRVKPYPTLLAHSHFNNNVRLLLACGVSDSNIARMISGWPEMICSRDIRMELEEVMHLRFDPLKTSFVFALRAIKTVRSPLWDAKVEAYKRWGWSQQTMSNAFRKEPLCMLASLDKINAVMSFWVNHLAWDSLIIAKAPALVNFSLEKRIIPRASVLQFLLSEGLMKKDASLTRPFFISEQLFLQNFVNYFQEKTSQLLELYEGKMNLHHKRENGETCQS